MRPAIRWDRCVGRNRGFDPLGDWFGQLLDRRICQVIAMDDRAPPSTTPVTTFLLPTDLPPGYYDLTLYWVDQDGGTGDPLRSVRVGTQ